MAASLWKSAWTIGAAIVPAVWMFASAANAQSPQAAPPAFAPPSVTVQRPIMPDRPPMLTADQEVAEWLANENHGEVAMAKLAESKAENQGVRQFAQRMVRDHSQMLQELRPFEAAMHMNSATSTTATNPSNSNYGARPEGPSPAGPASVAGTPNTPAAPGTAGTPVRAPDIGSVPTPGSVPNSSTVPTPGGLSVPGTNPNPSGARAFSSSSGRSAQPQSTSSPQGSAQFAGGNGNPGGLDFPRVQRQIAAQCLASATKQWDSKKPAEAEIAYIGHQIAAHEKYIDTSKVLRQYASPRLQSIIDQGIQGAESHLAEAKLVMGNLTQNQASESRTSTNAR
jgi:predicted outer membrane protein